MSEPKLVKVDNWGIYFLQRLKHFFNRTDYCDLTLQFQDNAQLKVHRLVLSACTEYFEVLERTCEMYDDCLVMPDDLQADVVVPIVNFMYTGQLEFKMDILEKLHSTSEIMALPVLTKLLDSHRPKSKVAISYTKRQIKPAEYIFKPSLEVKPHPTHNKRTYTKAFDKEKTVVTKLSKGASFLTKTPTMNVTNGGISYRAPSPIPLGSITNVKPQKFVTGEPRPTRYELPEELDTDNIFENSFCNISYESQPLMVHPETKQYNKKPKQVQASGLRKFKASTLDIVECKRMEKPMEESIFEESNILTDETEMFKPTCIKAESDKDPNKLFDQLLDQGEERLPKVSIETSKSNKLAANLDHAKIISEVLKKYPHLVKSNKNIKLKIFNSSVTKGTKKQKASPKVDPVDTVAPTYKPEQVSDFTYETDVLDSQQAAKLISLGAENVEGPWICLICGTPGRALHFTSYYVFRRHLVEMHHEKPVLTMCEYCGQRISKRNHLLHHLYTKHGVEPPPSYNFPKCPHCTYVALTEALLVKHKLTHTDVRIFRCNVCPASFNSSSLLLSHIQATGHKYVSDRKHSHQCIYCLRVFLRESNLYAHLKTNHKQEAVRDGIIDESDDESKEVEPPIRVVKNEPAANDYEDMEYQIQHKPGGQVHVVTKIPSESSKQKILNSGLPDDETAKPKFVKTVPKVQSEPLQKVVTTVNENNEEIVVIDNNEYILSGNRLILRRPVIVNQPTEEYILSDMISDADLSSQPSTSMTYATEHNPNIAESIEQANVMLKNTEGIAEPIPIYVSNDEEYKAIMSSNNIIFDSNDANKTLTVLTTPDAATLDTRGIDMDTTQNNDMMIIQDNYPINVSEAVVTDNSGIVVMYSHQVAGPNKYQLLTTQALGPQYPQSSSMLTQNYGTVTTTTPVMSAHELDAQVTWQEDTLQNIDQQTESNVQLQTVQSVEVVDTQATVSAAMSELPAVRIVSNIPVTTSLSLATITGNISDIPVSINTISNVCVPDNVSNISETVSIISNVEIADMSNVTETANITETIPDEPAESVTQTQEEELAQDLSMETDVPFEAAEETNDCTTDETVFESREVSEEVVTKTVQEPETIAMEQDLPEVIEEAVNLPDEIDSEEPLTEAPETEDIPEEEQEVLELQPEEIDSEVMPEIQQHQTESDENMPNEVSTTGSAVSVEPASEIDPEVAENDPELADNDPELADNDPEVAEKIHIITSDWSEDDAETHTQDSAEDTNTQECTPGADSEELEESIENIQQELDKQVNDTTTVEPDDEITDNVSLENEDEEAVQEDTLENSSAVDPQEKISSLLNDWDDNDSQADTVTNANAIKATEAVNVKDTTANDKMLADNNLESEITADNISTEEAEIGQTEAESDEIIENTSTDDLEENPGSNEPISESDNVETDKNPVNKQDKIKSLVSDWDDDDDENKD